MSGPPPFFMQGEGFDPMQMLFQGGLGNADPRIIEQLFAAAGAGMNPFEQGFERAGDPDPRKKEALGASASTLRNLPRVKVTGYDIAANESPECSVCLDDLQIGATALRIPCGHLFHEDCVKEWLKKSNECPVCRWELPTDDQNYEKGRAERMKGRKIRLRQTDLTVKTAAELRRFAHFLGVDVKDCLEKGELVEKIGRSPQVLIVSADEAECGSSPSMPREPMFSPEDLEKTSISDLKAIMERLAVKGSSSNEKAELIRHLHDAGLVLSEAEARSRRESAQTTADVEMSSSNPTPSPPLAQRSVGQLKALAKELGIGLDGCLEKTDIVNRIESSPAFKC